jgi:hypothetical protein
MRRSLAALASLLSACCACAPPAGSEPAPHPFEGGQLAHGYGVTLRRVVYVPNDRAQSFGLVDACESADGSSCGPHAWAPDEVESLEQATARLGAISGFDTRVDGKDPEVRVHAELQGPPGRGCLDGSETCWFGSTLCAEPGSVLLDAHGAALTDSNQSSSWTIHTCARWSLEVALVNIYAWADFLGLERRHVLRSVLLHEMGHSLGLEHSRSGLMRAHLPVCYFIDPGDPRDNFDPASGEDAFQRFQCLEGVKEPVLAAHQRSRLDAFREGGPGWAIAAAP